MQPQAFNTYAESYDEYFTNSIIGRAQVTKYIIAT
jgi:hypothetical protein